MLFLLRLFLFHLPEDVDDDGYRDRRSQFSQSESVSFHGLLLLSLSLMVTVMS